MAQEKAGVEDPYDLPDPDLKIILLGDSAVGKSKLIERYLMDEYNPRQVRVVSAIYIYSFEMTLALNDATLSFPHMH
jgi:Rab-like protein 2